MADMAAKLAALAANITFGQSNARFGNELSVSVRSAYFLYRADSVR